MQTRRHGRSTGVQKDAATLSFPCSGVHRRRMHGIVRIEGIRTYTGAGGSVRLTERHRFDRNRSHVETHSLQSAGTRSLMRERERVHECTHTKAGTRAESRSQSPAVGGRFDVADAAATFATLNTFISRSPFSFFLSRCVPLPKPCPLLFRFSLLLCSCTTLLTSFRNSSPCPRTELHPLSSVTVLSSRVTW